MWKYFDPSKASPSCSRCSFKRARSICGSEKSEFQNKTIKGDHSCPSFAISEAHDLFVDAGVAAFKGTPEDWVYAAQTFEKAIEAGLPEDEEVFARTQCASLYGDILMERLGERRDAKTMVESQEARSILMHMQKSIQVDRQGGYGYFAKPLERSFLSTFDTFVSLTAGELKEAKGPVAAIQFLEENIQQVSYLPSSPMISSLLELGNLHVGSDTQKALTCFRAIVAAEPVIRSGDNRLEARSREMAQHNVKVCEARLKPKDKAGCFIATAVYGSETAREVAILREYRETCLIRTPLGRILVTMYYVLSPAVARLLSKMKWLAWIFRLAFLDRLVQLLEYRAHKKLRKSDES